MPAQQHQQKQQPPIPQASTSTKHTLPVTPLQQQNATPSPVNSLETSPLQSPSAEERRRLKALGLSEGDLKFLRRPKVSPNPDCTVFMSGGKTYCIPKTSMLAQQQQQQQQQPPEPQASTTPALPVTPLPQNQENATPSPVKVWIF